MLKKFESGKMACENQKGAGIFRFHFQQKPYWRVSTLGSRLSRNLVSDFHDKMK